MNQEAFKQYIEKTRDCDAAHLDLAIKKGLHRAKSEKLDYRKLVSLAAMCAATAVLCIALSLEPVKMAASDFRLRNSPVTQSTSEALVGYVNDMTHTLIKYLGGN